MKHTSRNFPTMLAAMTLAAMMALSSGTPAANAFSKTFRFSATGEGIISAVPDIARVEIGVNTRAKSAADALRQNTEAMQSVFDSVKQRFGIAGKDMATTNFNVNPVYFTPRDDKGNPTGPARLVAYEVHNQLLVTVRDLGKLGALLDSVVRDGANRLEGLSFGFSNREKLLNEARRKAVEQAKAKARLYAEAVGFRLGPVLEVREGGTRPTPKQRIAFARKAMAMQAAAPVPVASGEQKMRVRVTITWEAMSE